MAIRYPEDHSEAKLAQIFHAVLTRYNLAIGAFRDRLEPSALEKWMHERAPVFRDYCAASLRLQTKVPDLWIIGLDEQLDHLSGPIRDAIAPLPFARLSLQRFQDGQHEPPNETLIRPVLQQMGSASHVITMRLDCDDIVHSDHIARIQQKAKSELKKHPGIEDFTLTCPSGAMWQDNKLYERTMLGNNFVSRVVAASKFAENPMTLSAFSGRHGKLMQTRRTIKKVKTDFPMWVQNYHGNNLAERSAGRANLLNLPAETLAHFPEPLRRAD